MASAARSGAATVNPLDQPPDMPLIVLLSTPPRSTRRAPPGWPPVETRTPLA
jgi:hypothetical protein